MARTTRGQLESMVGHVRDALVKLGDEDAATIELDDLGADYPYRYAVVTHGGSQYAFAERYWKAGDLWDALRMTLSALQRVGG